MLPFVGPVQIDPGLQAPVLRLEPVPAPVILPVLRQLLLPDAGLSDVGWSVGLSNLNFKIV